MCYLCKVVDLLIKPTVLFFGILIALPLPDRKVSYYLEGWDLLQEGSLTSIYVKMHYMICRVFVDSDNEDDESKFIDDEDKDESGPSYPHVADDGDDEEDELDKFMAGIEVL